MMIGLPASGKSTYVKNRISENLDKNYNILGTSSILDRMKVRVKNNVKALVKYRVLCLQSFPGE
jgi:predicted kinase